MRCAGAPLAAAARIMIAGKDRPLIEFHIAFSLLGLRNIRIKTLCGTYVLTRRYMHHRRSYSMACASATRDLV
jgi:hypothetical protein